MSEQAKKRQAFIAKLRCNPEYLDAVIRREGFELPPEEAIEVAPEPSDHLDRPVSRLFGSRWKQPKLAKLEADLVARGIATIRDFSQLSRAEALTLDAPIQRIRYLTNNLRDRYHLQLRSECPWPETGPRIEDLPGGHRRPLRPLGAWGLTHLGQLEHLRFCDLIKIANIGVGGAQDIRVLMAECEGGPFYLKGEHPDEQ